MSWEIEIYSPNGSLRRTLTPADALDSARWAVRGDGDCLEGEIVGRGLDLRPRDVVAIKAGPTPTFPTRPYRYWGWVTESADPRHPHRTATRLVGGRKRLGELLVRDKILGDARPAGWDVAALARLAANNANSDPLLLVQAMTNTGFTLSYRLPRLETIADALEAFKASAPGFTVEAGSIYTYGALTYQPGDEVPPVEWGVRAAADPQIHRPEVFFARDTGSLTIYDELEDRLSIDFQALSSEDVVDDVTLLLFAEHNADSWAEKPGIITGSPAHAPEPVSYRRARGTPYGAQRLVNIPALDGLKKAPAPTLVGQASGWSNASRAYDNDLTTYASNLADPLATMTLRLNARTRAIRIRYSAHVGLLTSYVHSYAAGWPRYTLETTLPATKGEQRDHVLLLPTLEPTTTCLKELTLAFPWEILHAGTVTADSVRVYDVAPLELDEAVLARIAESHMRIPTTAATITDTGRLLPATTQWAVDLAAGGRLRGRAEQIEYAITREEGFSTRVHLNQAHAAGATSQRAVIDQRIRTAIARAQRLTP